MIKNTCTVTIASWSSAQYLTTIELLYPTVLRHHFIKEIYNKDITTSKLKIYKLKNGSRDRWKVLKQEMMVLQCENPYFAIYYNIAQWATLTC